MLVIGSDVFSRLCDPADRGTVPIFGDGAGAVVLRRGLADEPGALGPFDLHSEGDNADLLIVPAGGAKQRASADPHDHFVTMLGQPVFRHACARMAESARTVLDRSGLEIGDVDRFVAHQANIRILLATAKQLGMPEDRVVANIGHVGNTSAASIPLALADACEDGSLRPKHRVLLTAFGAGLTWGSTLLTWPDVKPG